MINSAIPTTLASLKTDATRAAYGRWLNVFAEWHKENQEPAITYDIIVAFMETLSDFNPASRIQALSALKRLCDTIHKTNREAIDLYENTIIQGIKGDKYKASLRGKMILEPDLESLLHACRADDKSTGRRDASIISILYCTGMRRAECSGLSMDVYDPDDRTILLKKTKNKSERTAYLNPMAIRYLNEWFRLRGADDGLVYWRAKTNGEIWRNRGFGGQAIYNILKRRCSEAGLEFYAPHDFRRTLISNLLDKGVDISLVSKIVGHSSTTMTARYDVRDNEAMRQAIESIKIPYV